MAFSERAVGAVDRGKLSLLPEFQLLCHVAKVELLLLTGETDFFIGETKEDEFNNNH